MKDTLPQREKPTPKGTISLEFTGLKLKIPVKGLTLDGIEEIVFDTMQEIGRGAMIKALEEYDKTLMMGRPARILKNLGKKGKWLQTRVGSIWYNRRLYREKASGAARYLLDEALKIGKNQRVSLKLAQIFGALAAKEPYRAVGEQISKLMGITYSHEAIRQNVVKEGLRIEDREEKELKKVKLLDYRLPRDIPEVLYTETDATYIRKQQRGKKKKNKKKHFEVKLGINYTGKESRYKMGAKKSRKLTAKKLYVGIKMGRNKFLENLSYISEREYGLSMVKKSFFAGDGDRWIRSGKKEYFPGAIYLLCLYHLFRRLREALPGQKEQHKQIKVMLEENKVTEALGIIRRLASREKDKKRYELLDEFYGYVRNNRDGIESSMRLRKEDGDLSAGAVEPNIDKTIVHRFKRRGMSWSEKGASALLKIRQTIENNEWDDWWYEKRDQKIEVKAIFKEPLSSKVSCKRQQVMPYIEATLPCYRGPDQGKPWVNMLRELSRANLLQEKLNTID